jgi:hypothetical protein
VYTVTQGTVGTYNILVTDDAFAPSRVHSPYTASGINRSGDTQIYPSLGKAAAGDVAEINNPLYLGIIVSGVEAEISNIIIKQGDTEVYSKPAPATPYPPVQSVSITNEAGTSVEVDGNLRMTASVSPEGAYQGVTWEVDTNDLQYAQIDPTTGTLTGLDIGTAKVYAVSIDNGAGGTPVRSAAFTINITEPEETVREGVFFSWNAATDEALETISNGTSKEINGTPVVVLSKPATAIIEGTKGYSLKDNRFVIGSTSTAATTANDTIVDGTLDLGASFRITIKYASCEGTVFQIYLNNNTGSQGASMLGNASRIWNDEEVPTGGTIEIDVDPSTFTTNNNSLKTGFVSLRADSATTILVTSITLEYLTE